MEILSGMIVLLQVVISIQIMLVGKRVLQRIDALETKMTYTGKKDEETMQEEEPLSIQGECVKEAVHMSGDKAEALLNEVLSEVFS